MGRIHNLWFERDGGSKGECLGKKINVRRRRKDYA